MAINFETLALAKKFASALAVGNYTNVRVEGTTVIFTLKDGQTCRVTVPTPQDGKSIESVSIDNNKHLICTLSDGSKLDGGLIPYIDDAEEITYTNESKSTIENVKQALDYLLKSGGVLQKELKATVDIGSVKNGKIYAKGTELENIIRDILIKQESPTISLTLDPNKVLYDLVEDTISSQKMKIVVGKKTNPISKLEIYVNNVLVKTETSGISDGGTINYTYDFSTPTNENYTIKTVVTDIEGLSSNTSKTVKFVGKSYYGYIDPNIGEPTESQIKVLQNNKLKDSKGLVYNNITFAYNKVVYAYPKSMGDLTSIKDVPNNINYTQSFTKIVIKIDNIDYNVYTLTEPAGADGVELTFA